MKVTKCCGAKLYKAERVAEDEYGYGVPRPVLCCSNCGCEMPEMVEAKPITELKEVCSSEVEGTIAYNEVARMKKDQKEFIKELDGTEIFFRDLGAVGIDASNMQLVRGDWREKITSRNYKEVVDAYNMTEYGTTDMNRIMEMEGF